MFAIAIVMTATVTLFAIIWGVVKVVEYLGFIEIRDDE